MQIEVPIEAVDQAVGSIGNVDAGQINTIADAVLADQVEVRNIAPTVGGHEPLGQRRQPDRS